MTVELVVAFVNGKNARCHEYEQEIRMRLLLAILLPWFQFFTIGRPFAGIICLILQITLIGWIPAAIWSVYALSQYNTDKKIARAMGGRS